MKLPIKRSDGLFYGETLSIDDATPLLNRHWYAPPHPHYSEYLIDNSGLCNPSHIASWYVVQLAHDDFPDSGDQCAPNSRAIEVKPVEALHWFDRNGYQAPEDLLELISNPRKKKFRWPWQGKPLVSLTDDKSCIPLTKEQQEIWNALEGKALMAKELVKVVEGGPISESAIEKRIKAINKTRRVIKNRRCLGFYRPDAPPESG